MLRAERLVIDMSDRLSANREETILKIIKNAHLAIDKISKFNRDYKNRQSTQEICDNDMVHIFYEFIYLYLYLIYLWSDVSFDKDHLDDIMDDFERICLFEPISTFIKHNDEEEKEKLINEIGNDYFNRLEEYARLVVGSIDPKKDSKENLFLVIDNLSMEFAKKIASLAGHNGEFDYILVVIGYLSDSFLEINIQNFVENERQYWEMENK